MGHEKLLPAFVRENYEVHEWRHASAILATDFPNEWKDIIEVLSGFNLLRSEVEAPGGGRSPIAKRIDDHFVRLGWKEHRFNTKVVVDQTEIDAPTHKVDNFKNQVACDLEWNNKTEFYDRDLNVHVGYARHAISIDENRASFQRVKWGIPRVERDTGQGNPEWFEQLWFSGNHLRRRWKLPGERVAALGHHDEMDVE